MWVFQDDLNKKQTGQQTNKQTKKHFLDPEYLSQIKSDPRKIFRVYSCGFPKMIKIEKQTVKLTNKQINFF